MSNFKIDSRFETGKGGLNSISLLCRTPRLTDIMAYLAPKTDPSSVQTLTPLDECFTLRTTLFNLTRSSETRVLFVERKSAAKLWIRYSNPLLSATRYSSSPKSSKFGLGSMPSKLVTLGGSAVSKS
eukprot:Gb_25007 [translate_table: standard]